MAWSVCVETLGKAGSFIGVVAPLGIPVDETTAGLVSNSTRATRHAAVSLSQIRFDRMHQSSVGQRSRPALPEKHSIIEDLIVRGVGSLKRTGTTRG